MLVEATPQCIFCELPSGSNEHVWPDWLVRHLLANEILTTDGAWSANEYQSLGMETIWPLVEKYDFTTTCVCQRCNNGWMHKLEDRASPILKGMILGAQPPLTSHVQTLIARWAIKTALVFESRSDPANPRTSRVDCEKFRLRQRFPDGTVVWLCPYDGAMPISHTRLFFTKIGPDTRQYNCWHTTLTVGKIVIEVHRDTVPNANPELFSCERLNYCRPLFPAVSAQFPWPTKALNDGDIGRLTAKIVPNLSPFLRERLFPE